MPARRRLPRLLGVALVPVAIFGTALGVIGSSYAAFTGKASSPSNAWSTGTVLLDNTSSGSYAVTGSAVFSSANSADLKPGGPAIVKCIKVRSSGTLTSAVKIYAANFTQSNSFGSYLDLTIERGDSVSGTAGDCTGFANASTIQATTTVASFVTARTAFTNGLAIGVADTGSASPRTYDFRITVSPKSTMTDTQQNSNAKLDFVWEAQNS